MDFNIEIIGFFAAILTTSSFVPQVYKIWKIKEVDEISFMMYLSMLIGVSLWFYYGYLIDSVSMMISNVVSAILVICILYFKIKYSKK
jgi:MtN3 and saliva related transmembrane protein